MKHLLIALVLCLSLTSCHKKKTSRPLNVMENKKSLVNRWYGKDHFDRNPESDKEKSLNKTDTDDSVEIDAGEMTPPPTQPDSSEPTANLELSGEPLPDEGYLSEDSSVEEPALLSEVSTESIALENE